ncbi:MAG: hypothetical protein GWN79_21615, partial [Actinobacteria bacterium]|nr:hypothetical protein [Actinomycetota bacterium]NIU21505.1 hypothetical protein [Actinomycetota bacterium]
MPFCFHCGHATLADDRSCVHCGSLRALGREPARTESCETCLASVAPAWRHCATCGTAVSGREGSRLVRTSIAAEAPAFVPQRSVPRAQRSPDAA